MPIVGTWEVLVILIAVILFGPKRIPEIARQIGSAMSELRKAGDSLMRELTREPVGEGEAEAKRSRRRAPSPPRDAKAPEGGKVSRPLESRERLTTDQVTEAAKKLGIDVEGKTEDEIRSEMMERIYSHQPEVNDHLEEKPSG